MLLEKVSLGCCVNTQKDILAGEVVNEGFQEEAKPELSNKEKTGGGKRGRGRGRGMQEAVGCLKERKFQPGPSHLDLS